MQLAAELAAKAAEARQREAERTKPMIQARHGFALLWPFHACESEMIPRMEDDAGDIRAAAKWLWPLSAVPYSPGVRQSVLLMMH